MQPLPLKIAAALVVTTLSWSSAHAVDVRGVRVWAAPDSTRVVLDLTGSASHSLVVMHNPERVVLDVPGGHLARGAHPAVRGSGAVKDVRLTPISGQLRVVLNLARASQAKSFLAKPNNRYGYRLVIDLGSPAAAKPVKVEHAPRESRDLIIAIDAGHGGEDPGAIGKNGLREKDVVLAIAKELAPSVNAEPGMKAVLTRNGDYFVPLRERMRRARAQQADLFVSIHADSIRDRSYRRVLGVHPLAAGRHRRGLALAGRAGECLRLDRRRVARRQGRCAGLGAAGSVAVGVVERESSRRGTRAASA
jgi:N-acetylmuramoyl-L-alanine amidase